MGLGGLVRLPPVLLLVAFLASLGFRTSGRLVGGAVIGRERLRDPIAGSQSNDAAILSGRAFVDVLDLSSHALQLTADVRDKYDFFGRRSSSKIKLTTKNEGQIQQLSLRSQRHSWSFGRFSPSAYRMFNHDGIEVGHQVQDWHVSILGGWAPLRDEKFGSLGLAHAGPQFGLVARQDGKDLAWGQNDLTQHMLIRGPARSNDRRSPQVIRYFGHTMKQQRPGNLSRGSAELVVAPSQRLENASWYYSQIISPSWRASTRLYWLDLMTYQEEQDWRESLAASRYGQWRQSLRFSASRDDDFETRILWGRRDLDKLQKFEGLKLCQVKAEFCEFLVLSRRCSRKLG